MDRITLFVDLLLPLHLKGYYTYRVPYEWNDDIKVGQRVAVQFGDKKIYTALVRHIHQMPPQGYTVKYILQIIDNEPIVNEIQFTFWEWIANYYLCYPGNVMAVALPSAFRLASESKVLIHPDYEGDFTNLTPNEFRIVEILSKQNVLTLDEVTSITGLKNIFSLIKTMIEKKLILLEEELIERYKEKKETYIKLAETYTENETAFKELFNSLEKKSFKQMQVLLRFIQLTTHKPVKEILKNELTKIEDISISSIQTLVKNGVFEVFEKTESRLLSYESQNEVSSITLSEKQQTAFEQIQEQFTKNQTVLLRGVTSSGKTEIYIKLIDQCISQGKQVLFLLPEIALTSQIINRLRKYFGDKVGVYHSRYNDHERFEIWNKVLEAGDLSTSKYQIILSARSGIFLPFHNLGLIIVDEEHDSSYKQYDPAPRYSARDAAIFLAHLHNAQTLLGSATPSLESYYNAVSGKYGLVELLNRYGDVQMPEIWVADLKEETRKKTMKSHFSSMLMNHIEEALANKEQVILFQNRRGFSLRLECDGCSWIPQCKHCDVSLIYHKGINVLRCHYCGYTTKIPEKCPACQSTVIKMQGFGTEKIEEELAIFFPQARITRMDMDTTKAKNAYQKIISDFEKHEIDILVGTQMVTKGLDFENVSVVGVLNADNMINFPDFRSYERSFQLMTQVSGRAGRKNKQGKVIIQSYNPWYQVIRDVIDYNYLSMYQSQITERKAFHYPPFYRLIKISLRHKDEKELNKIASKYAEELRKIFGERILGPEFPMVARVRTFYIKEILIKLEKTVNIPKLKIQLSELTDAFLQAKPHKQTRIVFDVDPM